jgi:hypothetical protein
MKHTKIALIPTLLFLAHISSAQIPSIELDLGNASPEKCLNPEYEVLRK